ncbi:hypothetical protein EDB85DRAFT_1613385 [Lactarius pseudohatsudake]|nr:hypothetical protein EDB85DRAFT_1613385 [Lactarius pseudohatsudake]
MMAYSCQRTCLVFCFFGLPFSRPRAFSDTRSRAAPLLYFSFVGLTSAYISHFSEFLRSGRCLTVTQAVRRSEQRCERRPILSYCLTWHGRCHSGETPDGDQNSPEDIGRRRTQQRGSMSVVSVLRHLYLWSWQQYAQLPSYLLLLLCRRGLGAEDQGVDSQCSDKALDGFGIFRFFFSLCAG